jgi:hypothetical protein
LSGGEQRRLQLLACLAARPNVLVLDEPTNDLDVETVEVLEQYLDEFSGVLVVVSHDRWFCDRVLGPPLLPEEEMNNGSESAEELLEERMAGRTSSLLVFEGGGVVNRFQGDYEAYFEALKTGKEGMGVFTECLTGFDSPKPLPKEAPKPPAARAPASATPTPSAKKEEVVEVVLPKRVNANDAPAPPKPTEKPAAAVAPSQRQLARAEKQLREEQQATKAANQKKKVKVSKKERKEYETIEAEVEELELAAVRAQEALDEANAGKAGLSLKEKMAVAGACTAARRAADEKMERYLELDELITMADG